MDDSPITWRSSTISYKNIRIPKRGGGTRLQRVKVLASGKYKFVKNLVKSASKSRKTKKKLTKKRKSKGGTRKTTRGFSTSTIFKFIRLGSVIAPAIYRYTASGGGANGLRRAIESYGGIDHNGKFDFAVLSSMWVPFIMTSVITHGIGKLNGIIRRL